VTYGELKRRLRRLGAVLDEERTRHELWLNPANGRRTLVPRHDRQDVLPGMLHAILSQLGLTRDDLDRA
jgi:predicted RNA binding protein YcfA (HicA-like mRNA interferase family)